MPAKRAIVSQPSTGGGGGIRTRGALAGALAFKASAFNHSATPPRFGYERDGIRSRPSMNGRSALGIVTLPSFS